MGAPKSRFKIWKASTDSATGFMVTPEYAVMAGAQSAFVAVSKEGCAISGPVSFITTGEQTRKAGLFVGMNEFVRMIPSTIVTPIPPHIPLPPVAFFASVALSLPFVMAMLV